ncbi:hypothetical protein ACIA8O_01500 [Kitasatospora sp. NPDC051853]|uniref:hypothetical protein n=1 Tax=Kitasatospora sp. NPDC051853 TaxID=3364058 RepID=UPI003795D108
MLAAVFTAAIAIPARIDTTATAASNPACTTSNVLSQSNFEIDANGNLKVDDQDCVDWLQRNAANTGWELRNGVLAKADLATGAGDDSFGKGTAEDNPNPTIVDGSIPPNKSDLKQFGVFKETTPNGKFLELFWTRVNNPQGTTNMDFELNQKFCNPAAVPTNCADNGKGVTPKTPLRTAGDKLITYDLSKGGTVPTISIQTWTAAGAWSQPPTVISGGANADALGTVNTSTIPAAETGGLGNPQLDPYTFGEAAIDFDAIFPSGGSCTTFGSAYLKSRSSDSFSSELKDFVAPEQVQISNCTSLTTNAVTNVSIGDNISDTATLAGAAATAGGTITFHLYSDALCATEVNTGLPAVTVSGPGDYGSGNFKPATAGTYYWTASYSGDNNNSAATTACGDPNESSVINPKAPTIATLLSASTATTGTAVHDSATLSGATATAGGTVTYTVFTDDKCSAGARDAGTKPVTNAVVTDSDALTFATPGTFYWQAVYSGDVNNLGATSVCTTEILVVTASTSIATTQQVFPQDSATVSSASGTPTGSVTFSLYGPNDTDCSKAAVYSQTVTLTNGSATTTNSTFGVATANGDVYRWKVVYGGDSSHNGSTSACGTESFTLTIANG